MRSEYIPRRLCSLLCRHCIPVISIIVTAGCAAKTPPPQHTSSAPEPQVAPRNAAEKMIQVGERHVDKFLSYKQAEGLRNMLGGARAVFVAPHMGGGAFIAGINSG